ncbi:MAG: 2-keto-4-pentenoate hydratase [Burkholderiales bacterium]
MEKMRAKEAAALLWNAWNAGNTLEALPSHCRPATIEEGYEVQGQIAALSGQAQFGWKIAATSKAGQAHIGVDGPLAGRLLQNRIYAESAKVPFADNQMRVAEAEFAFKFAKDLPSRAATYSQDEVLNAVLSLHPAIEIPNSRYTNFVTAGAPQLIADNACAHYFVLGKAAPNSWREMNLAEHRVTAVVAGKLTREGKGANVLGDPRIALAWLVNELSRLKIGIAAHQVVTTGTCVIPVEVASGDHVSADFGPLGRVESRLG